MLWNFLPNSRSCSCGQICFNLSWYTCRRLSLHASFFVRNFNDVIKNITPRSIELFILPIISFSLVLLRSFKDFILFQLFKIIIFFLFYIVKFLNETSCSSWLLDFRQRRYITGIALSWLLDIWWMCLLKIRWWWFFVNKLWNFIFRV